MAQNIPIEIAWQKWIECLNGNDKNSILNQIREMVWYTAIYKVIFESRKEQVRRNPTEPKINNVLHQFIDENYWQTQCAFIRRQTDKSYTLYGPKGIYSIQALFEDMKSHQGELTRRKYFELRNTSYYYEDLQKLELEFIRKNSHGGFIQIPQEIDSRPIVEMHQIFDRLSGKDGLTRGTNDVVMERVFTRLVEKMDTCRGLAKYVDKFVAHSATPESRTVDNMGKSKLTLKHLWDAHKILYELADFLSLFLLFQTNMPLLLENPAFYDYWENPFFADLDTGNVRLVMDKYRNETEKWVSSGSNEIWRSIEV